MRAHLSGVKALLTAASITVYVTTVPEKPTYPYVLLTAPTFMRDGLSLDNVPRDIDDTFTATAVGIGDDQCRAMQEKVFATLDRTSPTVTGYVTDVRRVSTGPVLVDRELILDSGKQVIYCADRYRYRATPA